MIIDLSSLHSNIVKEIPLDFTISFTKDILANTDIVRLDNIKVEGNITRNASMEDIISCSVTGEMFLQDSISLEEVAYPLALKIDDILTENVKKDENTLDIMEFLWENIILEIPLKFTKVEDLSKFHGDGWKVISEEELNKNNNPFSELVNETERSD